MRPNKIFLGIVLCCAAAQSALAEETICTDRPTNGNAVCTVPEGRFQLEMDLANWARQDSGNSETRTLLLTNPTLKFGLTDRSDVQVNIVPGVRVTRDTPTATTRETGVSDLLIRYKYRFSDLSAPVQYGIIPFITVPTADDGFGSDKVTAGLAIPVSTALSDRWTLVTSPQVNMLPDADGSGYHLGIVNLINLGYAATSRLSLYGELYAANDFDPDGETHVYTADFAAAYLVTKQIQLDVGSNIGLSRDAADLQVYCGLSVLF